MHAMTAAHTTLPLPTWVEVTNLANGKRVVVKVNDRGPFVDNRLIDLSYAAATELDMVRTGTTRVEVRAVGAAARCSSAPTRRSPPLCRRPRPCRQPQCRTPAVRADVRADRCVRAAGERRAARRAVARERLCESDRRQRAGRPAHAAPRAAGADCATRVEFDAARARGCASIGVSGSRLVVDACHELRFGTCGCATS